MFSALACRGRSSTALTSATYSFGSTCCPNNSTGRTGSDPRLTVSIKRWSPEALVASARCTQRSGMRGGEKDRRRTLDPRQVGGGCAEARRRTAQQLLDERHPVREISGIRACQPDIFRAAMAGADAEDSTAAGDLIEGCD